MKVVRRAGTIAHWRALVVVAGLLLVMATGCAASGAPIGAAGVVSQPADLSYVIPLGTASAEMRGEAAFTIPAELTLVTGQSIVIRNDDQAMHYFAEVPIAPGQTLRKTFGRPGAFGYGGVLSCSIAERKTVTITVVDRLPAGPSAGPR